MINLHNRSDNNVGDHFCDPARYLPQLSATSFPLVRRWSNPFIRRNGWPDLSGQTVIVGGGGLLTHVFFPALETLVEMRRTGEIKGLVAWGIGHNRHYDEQEIAPAYVHDLLDGFDLIGLRDGGDQYPWLPCASCEHGFFDQVAPPLHPVVLYEHQDFPLRIKNTDAPRCTNKGRDIETALAFLSSGETVITNSYHGAYWALLLARRVCLANGFSTKFDRFFPPMEMYVGDELDAALAVSHHEPAYLKRCRAVTEAFSEQVVSLDLQLCS